jgi:hypothetical protein
MELMAECYPGLRTPLSSALSHTTLGNVTAASQTGFVLARLLPAMKPWPANDTQFVQSGNSEPLVSFVARETSSCPLKTSKAYITESPNYTKSLP